MAASDALNPKLFHGSRAWLKPGDVVNPASDVWYEDEGDKPGAYASVRFETAQGYAKKWDDPLRDHPDDQRSLFHPVYEVEHMSEHADPRQELIRVAPDYRRDEQGFKVKGISGWSIGSV